MTSTKRRRRVVRAKRAPDVRVSPELIEHSKRRRRQRTMIVGAVHLLLVFLVLRQAPGKVTSDTKLDLVVSPWDFLAQGATIWNPIANAGILQNQAYGYLFPMGPAFGAMHSLGVPPWLAQRLWEAALICAAFEGMRRLASALGVIAFAGQIGAGLAYALAPRVVSELTTISSEVLPVAVLPWVVLPLVVGARHGSPRVAALLSGAAFALVGGVNATAAVAILVVPGWWLLTREPGPRRIRLMGWWALAIALASAWWIGPLLVLGKYSPPFLDWIESAAITTANLSPHEALRGSTQWVSYLGPDTWPGGWMYAHTSVVVAGTMALAALGLWGLSGRATRHRLFLLPLVVLGLVIMTFGHVGESSAVWGPWAQDLLDGPLAPLRNIHKFDPVVRLPLAIGVGHAITRLLALTRPRVAGRRESWQAYRPVVALGLAIVAVTASLPVLMGSTAVNARETAVATWWRDTGAWLDEHAQGRALIVPGSSNPSFLWGRTADEPLQAVTQSPWTTRDGVPLTNPGYIRYLDMVEGILRTGTPEPQLADLLRQGGIEYLVVRNDIDPGRSFATPPSIVRATLVASPGISLVKELGPPSTFEQDAQHVVDGGMTTPRSSVEIFQVTDGPSTLSLLPLSSVVRANGSADNLTPSLSARLGPATAAVFDPSDEALADVPVVLTDGIRKREAVIGSAIGKSGTMTAWQDFVLPRKVHDYLPDGAALSTYAYKGIKDVTATSSGADLFAGAAAGPTSAPWSAVDGTGLTAWYPAVAGSTGQALTIRFDEPWDAEDIAIQLAGATNYPTVLTVTTDAGEEKVNVKPSGAIQQIEVPAGETTALTLTIAAVSVPAALDPAGIAEISIPGITPQRYLKIPGVHDPDLAHFEASPGYRPPCRTVEKATYCDPPSVVLSEEQPGFTRLFELTDAASATVSGTARITAAPAILEQLTAGASPNVTASSSFSPDLRMQPFGLMDDDPATVWQASADDPGPWVQIEYPQPVTTTQLTLTSDEKLGASTPAQVRVIAGDVTQVVEIEPDGTVPLEQPVTATSIKIEILDAVPKVSTSSFNLASSVQPVGLSRIEVDGAPTTPPTQAEITLSCGQGPVVTVNGETIQTSMTASRADVIAGLPATYTGCDGASAALTSGTNTVSLSGGFATQPLSVDLVPDGSALASPPAETASESGSARITAWAATQRTVEVSSADASLLVIPENANAGWQASIDGTRLETVMVNGWQQGWVIPAGTDGTVELRFAPDSVVRGVLLGGGAGLLALGMLCLLPGRRTRYPALGDTTPPRWWRVLLTAGVVVAGYAVGGAAGLVAAALVGAGAAVLRRRALEGWLQLAVPVLLALAAAVVLVGPSALGGHGSPLVTALVYGAVAASCCCALLRARPER